jgi:hypothetical protein
MAHSLGTVVVDFFYWMDVMRTAPKYSRFVSRKASCLFCAFFAATKERAALVANPLTHFVTAEGRTSHVHRVAIELYTVTESLLVALYRQFNRYVVTQRTWACHS